MQQTLIDNLERINNNIYNACKATGRSISNIKILAATKTVSSDIINLLPGNGITLAGENRVQEFITKVDAVKNIEWHFIGSLQTNKVKNIIDKVSLIHSVDRVSLVDEIQKQSLKIGKVSKVLIEINAGEEDSKSGVGFDGVAQLYDYVTNQANVQAVGFMPVLPINASEHLYKKSQDIFEQYKKTDKNIDALSMGMSDDYCLAIKHGATIVRLGSCLFGARKY